VLLASFYVLFPVGFALLSSVLFVLFCYAGRKVVEEDLEETEKPPDLLAAVASVFCAGVLLPPGQATEVSSFQGSSSVESSTLDSSMMIGLLGVALIGVGIFLLLAANSDSMHTEQEEQSPESQLMDKWDDSLENYNGSSKEEIEEK